MNKKSLKRYGLGIVGLMCLLMGCSQEQPIGNPTPPTGKPVEVRLLVNAPLAAAVPNEDNINRLRLVVFGSAGASDEGALIVNKYYPTFTAGNILKEVITSGKRDIYLIANEPLAEGGGELDDYKNIATVADVHRLKLVYQGTGSADAYVPSEIPMCVEHLNKQIKEEATNIINGTVERTMAKVTLNLNIKDANFPAGKQMVIDHITIKNLPSFSYLIAKNYTEALVNSEEQKVSSVVPAEIGYDFSSTNTFYVPEYLFDDPDKGAYIEIIGHVNGEPDRTTKYTVKLGDAMDDDNRYGDKYHITRNHHYIFTGDVISYGETDVVAVTVAPWNTENMDVEFFPNHYFNIDRMHLEFQSFETSLQSSIVTNVLDWKLVKADGTTLFSFAEGKTGSIGIDGITYTLGGSASNATITVSRYVVFPIHQMTFIAKNLKVPFTVVYDNGLISKQVLYDAGWPIDELPHTGLQLAKRGKGVLPSGVAEGDDPKELLSTFYYSTPPTAPELGMGVKNAVAMADPMHHAAQYCRDMGEGWFLPSKDELRLIYANHHTLGASYSFTQDNYWSSSEYRTNIKNNWFVSLINGHITANGGDKFVPLKVRCVRII